jgi:glucosamine--fructose-6-phosphate aminotransferase (isomerizing)
MCGIIGYVGKNKGAIDIALRGLQQLEYRGYDSAGLAVLRPNSGQPVFLKKTVGRVQNLADKVSKDKISASCVIAHTRWATHGIPSVANAHPHHDCRKKIFVVHNGIIENHKYLKEVLQREGHKFSSATDSEVLAHLIERHNRKDNLLEDAVIEALYHVKGTFAIAVISQNEPNKIVAARRSSPLIIGIGQNEYFLASDASALTQHTKKVVYLDDDEIAVLTPDSFSFFSAEAGFAHGEDLRKKFKQKPVNIIDWDTEEAQKGGFPHFMLKEIHQQPESIKDSLRGRLIAKEGMAKLGGLEVLDNKTEDIERVVISACGTAYYAGLLGKYLFENFANIPTEVDLASEFRYRNPVFGKKTALLIISQSGETADSLAALRLAKKKGNLTLGLINTVGSSIARETDAGVYNHIGPEIGVASTKAFTSQVAILALFALFLGRRRQLSKTKAKEIIRALYLLSSQIKKILKNEKQIKQLVRKYKNYNNFLYVGRNYNYPVALEGALKLKEISYVHAEGYAAGEMKHGPIALIDQNFPTIAIAVGGGTREKMSSNMEEIKSRKGLIIAIAQEGDSNIEKLADDVFYIPKTLESLSPILTTIPLQLFAYYMAVLRGCDPDKPRNLAKSVTVE